MHGWVSRGILLRRRGMHGACYLDYVNSGMDESLRAGIDLFNRGEYFECHEVLEEAWRPERGPRRLFLQAVIHVAVGFYHARRGNTRGAQGQLRKALHKLSAYLPCFEGVNTARLDREARAVLESIEAGHEVARYPRIHAAASAVAGLRV